MTLFEMIEDARLDLDLTVMEFCNMIGISQTTYYKTSEEMISKRIIYKIARKTKLTKEELFNAPIKK